MKKMLNMVLTLIMLLSIAIPASAATPSLVVTVDTQEQISSNRDQSIQPLSWGGAAAPVTNIDLYDAYIDDANHLFVVLAVTGYGHDKSYINGNPVTKALVSSFTLDGGPGADGFIWSYDCGEITEPGEYEFTTVFTSTNYPYNQKSFSCIFTISYA